MCDLSYQIISNLRIRDYIYLRAPGRVPYPESYLKYASHEISPFSSGMIKDLPYVLMSVVSNISATLLAFWPCLFFFLSGVI